MNKIDKMRSLVEKLNEYRNAYYNYNISLVEDEIYDKLFDELASIEKETGIIMATSPTSTVGYTVIDNLEKVKHNHPMLSLDKTKDVKDIVNFLGNKDGVVMAKMDGLTCSVRYVDGELVSAETRGDGEIGENILHCAKTISNLPLKINCKDEIIVDGEVIVDYKTFDKINNSLPEEERYHHPRNLASGSIRQLDSKIAAQRGMKFIAWKLIKGSNNNSFFGRWMEMIDMGFDVVSLINLPKEIINEDKIKHSIELIKTTSKDDNYPIDGCVFGYDDIAYGDSLGATGHHLKSQYAFKFSDEVYETILRDIEWNTSRTGQINPVAVFDEVDLDGALTTRATLHNISIMKELKLGLGDTLTIYRANQVIPKVHENLTKSNTYVLPTACPCCGSPVEIRKDGIAEVMYCSNEICPARELSKFEHFVSKPCVNIDGLSEATLEKFIDAGFIKTYADIYHLDRYKDKIVNMEGFGEKSYNKLIDSIEKSRNIKIENFIVALGIPLIGKTASKTIAKYLKTGSWQEFEELFRNDFDFTTLDDFGKAMNDSLWDWYRSHYTAEGDSLIGDIVSELSFIIKPDENLKRNFKNISFCITGSLISFANREALITDIEKRGGKFVSSVSSKCNYLINNDINSNSSKNKKAKELNIPIITEEDYINMINMEV